MSSQLILTILQWMKSFQHAYGNRSKQAPFVNHNSSYVVCLTILLVVSCSSLPLMVDHSHVSVKHKGDLERCQIDSLEHVHHLELRRTDSLEYLHYEPWISSGFLAFHYHSELLPSVLQL